MADVTNNTSDNSIDSGFTTLHPSVQSNINNNDIIYQANSGSLPLFCCFTSEKGVDNKVQLYTDTPELLFNCGNPNLAKYGQEMYNMTNWLNSNGIVYGIRVLPDNAGFAHAFVNIQTRKETKQVVDYKQNLVSVANTLLKPALAFSTVNNTNESLLDYELNKTRNDETIDGFLNHLILCAYPVGRGKSYNNLGFRLTLNTSYDQEYTFRVYNFEVVKFDSNGSANVVDGPFYVSFNPDALSSSQESMFIEDVVNNYSQYLRVKFNETAYLSLANTINPNVDPYILDPITGMTRVVMGEKDTFFCVETQQMEDVHMYIQKYDATGYPVMYSDSQPVLNIIDPSDEVEQSILTIDNSYRNGIYTRYLNGVAYAKDILNSIQLLNYHTLIDDLLKTSDGVNIESGKINDTLQTLNQYQIDIQNLITTFNTSHLESDFTKIAVSNTLIGSKVNLCLDQLAQLLAYHKALFINADTLSIDEKINEAYNLENLKEIIDVRTSSRKDSLDTISNKILNLKTEGNIENQISALIEILSDIKSVIEYIQIIVTENDLSPAEITSIINDFNKLIDLYNTLQDPYTNSTVINGIITSIYDTLDNIVNSAYDALNVAMISIDISIINSLIGTNIPTIVQLLVPITYNNNTLYDTNIATTTGKNDLLSSIRKNIDSLSSNATTMKDIIYTNQLQNFNSPIRFQNGSDGDLDFDANFTLANSVKNQLLVKAYKGLIDETITDRRLVPYKVILDANYSIDVKNAITSLVRDIRKDIPAYIDTGFLSNPQNAIIWRTQDFNVSSNFLFIYGQDMVVYDEYTGKNIRVTSTYKIASMLPTHAIQYGLHYPMAGNRRGTVDGYQSLGWVPNEAYKELLYNKRINYIESNPTRTRFGSQLSSGNERTPLSDINNVFTALDIKVNVEDMAEDYQFEFEDDETISDFQYNLNDFLTKYINNRSCDEISASVTASDYDKQQHIIRVNITVKFRNVIERILININVVK